MSETPGEGPEDGIESEEPIESVVDGEEVKSQVESETLLKPEEPSSQSQKDDMLEADEGGDPEPEPEPQPEDAEFKVEALTLPIRKVIEILPAPSLGILVAIGFR